MSSKVARLPKYAPGTHSAAFALVSAMRACAVPAEVIQRVAREMLSLGVIAQPRPPDLDTAA